MLASMCRRSFADGEVCLGQGRSRDKARREDLERAQQVIGHIEAFFRYGPPQQA
jgi:hypothetical protein